MLPQANQASNADRRVSRVKNASSSLEIFLQEPAKANMNRIRPIVLSIAIASQ
jgi:hypothetical protein